MGYSPADGTWTLLAPMPTARSNLAAALLDGRLYAIGGMFNHSLANVECYDFATGTWDICAPLPTARYGVCAVAVGGFIYAIGGTVRARNWCNILERYNPRTN